MSTIDIFSVDPAEWPRLQDEIAPKVAEVCKRLRRCTSVHPVAAMLGATEAIGFESSVPLAISGIDFSDALAFPIRNCSGEILSALLVYDSGDGAVEETPIPGVSYSGGFIRLGKVNDGPIYVAIDLRSALAIAEATGGPVACAIYTDNLPDVAAALRARHPDKEIIVCAGTSTGESRPIAARAAAQVGAKLALAETGGTFYGCYKEAGAERIVRSLEVAEVPDPFELPIEQSNPLDPPSPTRWPARVNASLMALHAVILIRRYLVIDAYAAVTIVLWALATYFVPAIRVAPLLAFISPTKRCGKTTALGLLKSLVCRPYATSNVTPATLYRLPKRKPTLLIDEIDTFMRSRELVGIVNSGHTRDAASIARVEKGETVSFDTFFMKALFGIGLLPETLADRSILIPLERKDEADEVEKHIVSENDVFAPVRACFAQLAHLYADQVRYASRNPVKLGNDRTGDNWETLLAVAGVLSENWIGYARRAARLLSEHTGSESDAGLEELLRDIKLIFDSTGASRLSTKHLIDLLTTDEEKPWATYSHGRLITANDLAKMLKPLRIQSRNLREARATGQMDASPTCKGYYRNDFARAFRQYVPRNPDRSDEAAASA